MLIVRDSQRRDLQAANDADIAMIADGYRDKGVREAVEVVRQRLAAPPIEVAGVRAPSSYLLIQGSGGERLAGNLGPIPVRTGVFDVRVATGGDRAHTVDVRGRGVLLGPGVYVFAGRDWRVIAETRSRILYAFAWVAAGAAVIAALAGWFLGSRFMQRVDTISRTCEGIIAGRLSERIALRGRGDEWDRLAGVINEMLNRIATLMENLRQVSSDVAHDLRSPLTRLRNRLEVARSESTTAAEYAAAVARALEDTDQLLAMFSALLRISQIESGTRARAFSTVSLTELAQRLFEMYRPVAEDHRQELRGDIRPDVSIRGDPELLMQMASNLVENAIRHTPSGSVIRLCVGTEAGAAIVTVSDNGGGIPSEERGKVTRRFYRASTSRSAAGHGLGLALVSAICDLHHAVLELADAAPGLIVNVRFAREQRG